MTRKAKLLPDVDELKKMFYIDPSIPEGLRWKTNRGQNKVKDAPAGSGCKGIRRYFATGINVKQYLNHRIIYSIFNNINLASDQIIDHIDRNIKNNHPNNLRIVSFIENGRNQTKKKNASSKYIGVCFHTRDKKFQSRIQVNGKLIHLGYYLTEKEAALAYNDYIINQNLSHFNLNIIEEN